MKNWLKILVIIFSSVVFVTCTTTYEDEDTEEIPLPAVPTNLVVTAVDSSQIDIIWYVVSGATGYKVYRSTIIDGVYSEINNISSNSYTNIGLSSNTEYYYKVKAYNVNGESEFSNVASALTFVSTPSNLTATSVSSSQIDLSWGAVNGEANYRIYKSSSLYGTYNKIGDGSDNFYSNTGLKPNTVYYYKVKAYNTGGNGDYSNIASDTTIVTDPTNLAAAATSLSQIYLSWDTVEGAEGYYLYRSSTISDEYIQIYDGSATCYTDTVSNPQIKYFYKLKAYRSTKISDFSNTVDVRLSLLKPEGLSLFVQDSIHISLSWYKSSGVTGYFLHRSANQGNSYIARDIGNVLSYSDVVSEREIEYFYKIEAYNAVDTSEFSEIVKGKINVNTPENLTAETKSSSLIDLSWDAVDGARGYYLHRSTDGVKFDDITIVNDTFHHSTGLKANTEYSYKIQAYNNAHNSEFSSIVTETTVVAAPAGLSDTVVSSSQIDISWHAVEGADGYYFYFSANDGLSYSDTAVGKLTTYHSTGLTADKAYRYKVMAYNEKGDSEFSDTLIVTTKVLAPTNLTDSVVSAAQINLSWNSVAGATGYIIYTSDSSSGVYSGVDLGKATFYQSKGLTANTGYYYKVAAYSAAGESDASDIVSDTTMVAVPANFSYRVVDSSKIDLSWSKVDGATEYYLSFSADNGQTYSDTPIGTDTLYPSTGLEANTKYFYAVRAYNLRGYSEFSDTLSTYTMVLTPKNISAKSKSSSRIDISWSEVEGADGYKLTQSTTAGIQFDTILGNVTAYQSTGLTANTEYFYRVRAYSAVGDSKASSTVSDTTIVAPPSNLSDSVVSASRIDLRWDTVPGAASYTIYRTPASGGVNDSVGVASSNFYSDTGLAAFTVYIYKLKAYNSNGYSEFSSTLSDTTIVAAPSNLTNGVSSASQIDLYWDAVTGANGYCLSFSVDSGRTYSDTAVGNVTTYSDTGLAANSVHYYKVRAYNTKGYSNFSAILSDTTIVAAPSKLAATTRSSERIDLSWGKVAGATGYKVYQLNSAGTYVGIDLIADTLYHSIGLSPNTTYFYKVTAYSGAGESDTSSVVSDITIVAAPSNFTDSVVSSSQIDLSWDAVDGADGYLLAISADGVTYGDTVDCAVTTYSHAGLTANSVHYYKVLAYNGKGDGAFSSTLCDTTIVLAPTNLADSVVSASRIDLRWDSVAGAASYAIYRAPAIGGEYKVIGDTNSLIYHSTGLSANTAYFYKVLAYNGNGYSVFSDTLSDTTKVAAPSNLSDSVVSSSQIDLSWDEVDGATGYRLAFSADSGQSYSEIAVGNVTTYSNTGLAANSEHYYKVLAYNGKGDSEFSYTLIVTTLVAAPTSLSATVESSSQIDLAWGEVAGATGYKIYQLNSVGDSTEIGDVIGELAYESTGLSPYTDYSYKVTAYSDAGESEASSTVSKTTLVAAPSNFSYSVVSASQINLSWDPVKGATGYYIFYSKNKDTDYSSIFVSTSTTYDSKELDANEEYFYYVRAKNANGEGDFSDTLRATTIVAVPTGLSTIAKSSSQIDLVWDTVAGIEGYKIYRASHISGPYDSVGVASSESYEDSIELIANKKYYYKVRAYNGVGESDYSDMASDTTIVLAPTNLSGSAFSALQINLSWDKVDGATDYKVYRLDPSDGEYKPIGDVSSESYDDSTGLSADTDYSYKVTAYNGNGESEASGVSTVRTRVLAPDNLTAITKSASRIDLAWDTVPGVSSYIIYRAPSAGGAYDSIGVDSSDFYADSTGLSPYTGYSYMVKAYSDAGKSAYSEIATDTTMVAAPSNIIDRAISSSQIKLSWDLVAGATNYTIHRASTIGGDYWQMGGGTGLVYFDNSGLSANTAYFYKLNAHNAKGSSKDSEIIEVTTRVLAPVNLVATAKSFYQIDLAWGEVGGATSYAIYRASSSDGDYDSVGVTSSEYYNDSTGLAANKEYFYMVSASSASGESVPSDVASDTTIFLAPANLLVTSESSSRIGLSWSSVDGATSYRIYRALSMVGDYNYVDSASSESYEDSVGLTAHTEYYYRVTAHNVGGESDSSESKSATTRVATPANLAYDVVSAIRIDLQWDSVFGATSYKISRTPSSDGRVVEVYTTSYGSMGLSANTKYSYKVIATNVNGDGAASEIKATTRVLAPADLTDSVVSSSQINLSWNEVDGAQIYKIYRASSIDGDYAGIDSTSDTSYQSTELAPNTVYYYKVTADNGSGESEPSQILSDTTIVAAPKGLTDSVISESRIDLSWGKVDGATSYKIYRALASGGDYTEIGDTTTAYYYSTGLTANTTYLYKVKAHNTKGDSEFSDSLRVTTIVVAPSSVLATPQSSSQIDISWALVEGATDYSIYILGSDGIYSELGTTDSLIYHSTELASNTEYYYQVSAHSDAGESALSSVVSDTTRLLPPTSLTVIASGATQTNLSWQEVAGATSYKIYRALASDGDYDSVGVASSESYDDSKGLIADTEYLYKVTACNGNGDSEASQAKKVTTRVLVPADVSATATSSSQIDITWSEVKGATGYKIHQLQSDGTYDETDLYATLVYHSKNLVANTEYFYKVSAYSDAGQSALSSVASDTTIVVAPSNLTDSIVSASQIDVSWDTVPGATSYKISRALFSDKYYTEIGDTTATTYHSTELAAATRYIYKVKAHNGNGDSEESDTISATTRVLAPATVSATATSSSQIDIAWSEVEGATGYRIHQLQSDGTYSEIGDTSDAPYYSTGLTANTVYSYKVLAYSASGESVFSSVVSDTTIFLAPANFTDSVVSESRIDLKWEAVAGATSYYLSYSTDGTHYSDTAVGDVTSYSDTGLTAYTVYHYKVRAHNVGGYSQYSAILTDTTMVAAPANLTSSAFSSSRIDLSWEAVAGATSYAIYRAPSRDGEYAKIGDTTVTTYYSTGLAANTEYYYKVKARNAKGDGEYSDTLIATTRVLAPANLTDSVVSASRIDLRWDSVVGATSYCLYYSADGVDYLDTAVGMDTSYSDTGLTANTEYYYKVTAQNDAGESDYSDILKDTTIVLAPTNLTSNVISSFKIDIAWDSVAGATGYKVDRLDSDGSYLKTEIVTDTLCHSTGLSAGTEYLYTVRAYNTNGNSEYSDTVSATTIVAAPTGFSATATNSSQINLSWGKVAGAKGYKIYRSTSSGETLTLLISVSSESYSNTGLSVSTTYYYKVTAYSDVGESESSSQVSATTILAAPINLAKDYSSSSQITLSWSSVAGATSYKIYRSTSSGGPDTYVTSVTSESGASKGLSANTTYYYKVTACDANGESGYSNLLSVTTNVLAPTNLSAKTTTFEQIDLSWNSVSGATKYNIYRATSLYDSYELITSVTSTTYDDTGIGVTQNYYYKVKAYSDAGLSDYSTAVYKKPYISKTVLRARITADNDVSEVNTGMITDMSSLFLNNTTFNQDISGWDVSNVTDMNQMFYGASAFNQDIGGWVVSNVKDMSYMFYYAGAFNQDIGGWDVSNVKDMSYMFYSATSFNQTLNFWETKNVTDMSYMFYKALSFNKHIGSWHVYNVTTMKNMFCQAEAFNQNINYWDVSNVTDMSYMFSNAYAFNQPIRGWNVSSVTKMVKMFFSAYIFNQDISDWNVSSVTDMAHMFNGAKLFFQNLGNWDVSKVTSHDSFSLNTYPAWNVYYQPYFSD